MKRANLILSLLLTAFFALNIIAQQPLLEAENLKLETEKKALELLEQILAEAQSLRLPENRVRIKAMAAGMLWEKDQTRARTYLQETENDLKQMIQALGDEKVDGPRKRASFNQFRTELIRNLSQFDPQLALDLLHNTRVPDEYKQEFYSGGYDPETQLEAELMTRIASRDPAKALKAAEELLQKGFSQQILSLADSIRWNEQSRPAVTEIYKKVISKLATEDLLGNQEAVNIATRLLQQANSEAMLRAAVAQAPAAVQTTTRGPYSVMDDQMFRELIEATAKAAAKTSSDNMRNNNANRLKSTLQAMQPAVEKYAPAQAALLKAKPATVAPNGPQPINQTLFNDFRTLSNSPTTTNDQLIEFAKKATPQEQSMLYQQIAMRALNKGDAEQAKQIMDTYVKDPRMKENFEQMRDSMAMGNALRKGNVEEAKQIIARIQSPQRKAEQMISLAQQIMQKDKPGAATLLDEAATILGSQVENVQQVNAMISLARAYATVTPDRSFELSDAMAAKFNTIIAAASVLDAFELRNGFEQGEAKVNSGGSMYWLSNFTNNLTYLATIDFERAKQTAERFDRVETRLHALVSVATGVLRPRPQSRVGIGVPPPPPMPVIR